MIDVVLPVLDLTSEEAIEISLQDTSIEDLKSNYNLDEITEIIDVTSGRVEVNIVDDLLEASNSYHRLKTLEIYSATYAIKVHANVYTKIIKSVDDFNEMLATAKVADQVYDGYFILGNDIDFEGANYTPTDVGADWFDGGALGFIGTFDGRGYAISNMTVTARGIFSGLGTGAMIKNTAFLNTKYHENLEFGLFGGTEDPQATLENLFIEITSSLPNKNGLLVVGYGVNINNVIMHIHSNVELSSAITNDYYGAQELFVNNVYIIAENSATLTNTQNKNYTNVFLYNSETQLAEDGIEWAEKGFGLYWKFDGNIPYLSAE